MLSFFPCARDFEQESGFEMLSVFSRARLPIRKWFRNVKFCLRACNFEILCIIFSWIQVSATEQLSDMKQFTEALSVLSLQVLSGCSFEASTVDVVPVSYRVCWLLSSSNYWTLYPQLATVAFQLLPALGTSHIS